MKVYVGGKWQDKVRVRAVMDVLRAHGHTITHDWTYEDPKTPYYDVPITDIRAIERADCIVLALVEDLGYTGSWVEMGAALAYGRPVYIIYGDWLYRQFGHSDDPTAWRNVFLWHPLVQHFSRFPDHRATSAVLYSLSQETKA